MLFYSYFNGYGYERLAIVTENESLLARYESGGWEPEFVQGKYEISDHPIFGLVEDPVSKTYWETLSINDPDGMYFLLYKENEEDVQLLNKIHAFLKSVGVSLPHMFITNEEGLPEKIEFNERDH